MLHSVLRTLSLLAGVAAAGVAQAAAAPYAPLCGAGGAPAIDSTPATVAISAAQALNTHLFSAAERARMLFHADAIRQHFVAPVTLGRVPLLAESPDAGWGGARSDHSAVGGKLVLVLRPNGRLRETYWQLLPASERFAFAIALAVQAADSAGEFATIPPRGNAGGWDTVVVQLRSTIAPPAADELSLMRVRLPRYVSDVPARRTSESPLFFPMHSDGGMVENEGEMVVVVGNDGRADMSRTQVTRIEAPNFLGLMQRLVAAATYEPAVSGGCLVPSVVIERFKLSSDR